MSALLDYARAGLYLCLRNGNLWANGRLLPEEVGALTEQRAELVKLLQAEPRSPSPKLLTFAMDSARMLTQAYNHTDEVSTEAYIESSQALGHAIKQKDWPAVRRACCKIVRVLHPVEDVWRKI